MMYKPEGRKADMSVLQGTSAECDRWAFAEFESRVSIGSRLDAALRTVATATTVFAR
jgi:hypothetical protein